MAFCWYLRILFGITFGLYKMDCDGYFLMLALSVVICLLSVATQARSSSWHGIGALGLICISLGLLYGITRRHARERRAITIPQDIELRGDFFRQNTLRRDKNYVLDP